MTTLVHQLRFEQKIFWRSREAAVFIFIFPLLLYALLGSVYGDEIDGDARRGRPPRRPLRLRRGERRPSAGSRSSS